MAIGIPSEFVFDVKTFCSKGQGKKEVVPQRRKPSMCDSSGA
jgi:hypothetical protein